MTFLRAQAWGSATLSLCRTAHPLHTRLAKRFGGSIPETAVRPNPAQASPHTDNVAETVSTLRFGQRAKTIKTKVRPTPRRPGRRANLSLSSLCSHRGECTGPHGLHRLGRPGGSLSRRSRSTSSGRRRSSRRFSSACRPATAVGDTVVQPFSRRFVYVTRRITNEIYAGRRLNVSTARGCCRPRC